MKVRVILVLVIQMNYGMNRNDIRNRNNLHNLHDLHNRTTIGGIFKSAFKDIVVSYFI
jgi:hypothetical protein